MALSIQDIADESAAERDADLTLNDNSYDLINALIIVSKADVTQVDAAGDPVYDEEQRDLILKAKAAVGEW